MVRGDSFKTWARVLVLIGDGAQSENVLTIIIDGQSIAPQQACKRELPNAFASVYIIQSQLIKSLFKQTSCFTFLSALESLSNRSRCTMLLTMDKGLSFHCPRPYSVLYIMQAPEP
jgi:hypothetical protein